MRNILAIWQREIKSYFVSPIAYVVLTVFLFLFGVFFSAYFFLAYRYTMSSGEGAQSFNVPAQVTGSLFSTTTIVLLLVIPMLTMALFSEEKRRGTIELLLTTPVGNLQVLLGKYLASLSFLLILFASSAVIISPLFIYSQPDLKPILVGYLGLLLYGAALLAMGVFISTLTENQIIAVFLTFGISLFLLVIKYLGLWIPGKFQDVVNYLSLTGHLEDSFKGVIDTSHLIYYVTFTFVGLFLAYRSLESMRWKG